MKSIHAFLLCAGLTIGTCFASEELPLPLASADVRGLAKAGGEVRIQIASPKGSIESVKITVFGKAVEIPEAEFAKLKHVIYSEVSLSHEGGYKEQGGPAINFVLRFRDTFGGDPFEGAPMLEERVTIAVPQNAPVKVTKVRTKVAS